jgi:hypothetical protein
MSSPQGVRPPYHGAPELYGAHSLNYLCQGYRPVPIIAGLKKLAKMVAKGVPPLTGPAEAATPAELPVHTDPTGPSPAEQDDFRPTAC